MKKSRISGLFINYSR